MFNSAASRRDRQEKNEIVGISIHRGHQHRSENSEGHENTSDETLELFLWGGDEKRNEQHSIDSIVLSDELTGKRHIMQVACPVEAEHEDAYVVNRDGTLERWKFVGGWSPVQPEHDDHDDVDEILRWSQVASGYNHHAAVAVTGAVYTWGQGHPGGLGRNPRNNKSNDDASSSNSLLVPKRVLALVGIPVQQVACGVAYTVALTRQGDVFTWGDNLHGKTGLGVSEGNQLLPRVVPQLHGIRNISLSSAVSWEGKLYTWGSGRYGRLGHGTENDVLIPQQVQALAGISVAQASCSYYHTTVRTDDSKVYTFGRNQYGQLGHGDLETRLTPTLVEELQNVPVVQVSCGAGHSVACTQDGRLYTWGYGKNGRLGHGSSKNVLLPKQVLGLEGYHVDRIQTTWHHTIALVKPRDDLDHEVPTTTSSSPIAATWRTLVNHEKSSDVTFLVENDRVFAIRTIICQRCPYFETMFRSGMQESLSAGEKPIEIPNVRKLVFLDLLEYLYTDTIEYVQIDHLVELYSLADMYNLPSLRHFCFTELKHGLTVQNAAKLLKQASEQSNYEEPKTVCMAFVVQNFAAVCQTPGIEEIAVGLPLELFRAISNTSCS